MPPLGLVSVPLPTKKPKKPSAEATGLAVAEPTNAPVVVDVATLVPRSPPRGAAEVAAPLPVASHVAKPPPTASDPPEAAARAAATEAAGAEVSAALERAGLDAAEEAEELSALSAAPRLPPRRDGAFVEVLESDALTPVEPAEPVSSANATGIAATADPIPNANASAPTRPM